MGRGVQSEIAVSESGSEMGETGAADVEDNQKGGGDHQKRDLVARLSGASTNGEVTASGIPMQSDTAPSSGSKS